MRKRKMEMVVKLKKKEKRRSGGRKSLEKWSELVTIG